MKTGNDDLTRHLPTETYLPRDPVEYTKQEELELRQRIQADLPNFESRVLKDLYLELTGFDRMLSGYISYADLSFTMMKRKVGVYARQI